MTPKARLDTEKTAQPKTILTAPRPDSGHEGTAVIGAATAIVDTETGQRTALYTCRAVTPPATDACGKPATWAITFNDGDKVATCHNCALYLTQIAQGHGTNVKAEKLT